MKTRSALGMLLAVIYLIIGKEAGLAEITLPPVLSSHMVLQRDLAVPVWGAAEPNEKISVEFAGQKKETTADAQGKWQVKLDPLAASRESRTMVISGASGKKELSDVLVGEVWVGSGQSNMQMGGGSFINDDEVLAGNIAAGPYPQLRVISPGQPWMEATPDNLKKFSALLFSFGLPLHKELKVPVGLLVGAVGGTPSGYWLSQEAYDNDQACKDVVAKYAATYNFPEAVKKYEVNLEQWKKAVEEARQKGESKLPREPRPALKAGECRSKVGDLYEKNILPYIPYAIRGVLWDQGEGGTAIEGVDQYTLMGALIRGWRKEWGQPPASGSGAPGRDFPFIYVQKPSGGGCAWDAADPVTRRGQEFSPLPATVPNNGAYRETHIRIMNYPNTFMVTSSDLGPGTHPLNKSGYGSRGARVALGAVYGKAVEIYGPIYKSHKVEDGKVTVSFDHAGRGLEFKHGSKLQGFALAGEDGKFAWAEAVIEGDKVVVASDKIIKPVAVRYAWANEHQWANLFNKDGLPAIPFRTDK